MNIKEFVTKMPKVELHVHIEGAVNAETYFNISQKNKINSRLKTLKDWEDFFLFKSFPHFLDVYKEAVTVLIKPSDYSVIIEDFFKNRKEQNIVYTEAFLSASLMIQKFSDEEILDAIEVGIKNGEKKYGVKVKIIPDISRNEPLSQDRVLELILKGKERDVFIGIGIGGLEKGFPPELFTRTYETAKKYGLRLTAHAGEGDGPQSVLGAIKHLKTERIGHGIRSLEDEKLIEILKHSKIPIDVSPTSNYCLKLIEESENHPIRRMVDSGCFCTLNSDDPAMFSTDLINEYLLLHKQGFSLEELIKLNMNGINASFMEANIKQKYLKELNDFINCN